MIRLIQIEIHKDQSKLSDLKTIKYKSEINKCISTLKPTWENLKNRIAI